MESSLDRFDWRKATFADVSEISGIITESVHGLGSGDYSETQRMAALESAFGLDTELIADNTYFVVKAESEVIACGGWSKRKTLFGGDKQAGRQSELLDKNVDSARIRAFFVKPARARLGIGRRLLELCEAEAINHGFHSAELVATLPGHRLYSACGYIGNERVAYTLPGGVAIQFIPMKKPLTKNALPITSCKAALRLPPSRLSAIWNPERPVWVGSSRSQDRKLLFASPLG